VDEENQAHTTLRQQLNFYGQGMIYGFGADILKGKIWKAENRNSPEASGQPSAFRDL
jgi:hypothetical protein